MHEMSIVKRFMNIALEQIKQQKLENESVESLTLEVGEMTDLVPHYLEKYYEIASKGTPLEASKLVIEPVPMLVRCLSCRTEYNPTRTKDRLCPNCGSGECHLLQGREVNVKSISLRS